MCTWKLRRVVGCSKSECESERLFVCAFWYAVYHELIVTTHHATYMFSLNLRWADTVFFPPKNDCDSVYLFVCFIKKKKKGEETDPTNCVCIF